jgi:hypothetical protein
MSSKELFNFKTKSLLFLVINLITFLIIPLSPFFYHFLVQPPARVCVYIEEQPTLFNNPINLHNHDYLWTRSPLFPRTRWNAVFFIYGQGHRCSPPRSGVGVCIIGGSGPALSQNTDLGVS